MTDMTPSPSPQASQPAPLSEVDRLTGVLFDPKPAFVDIAARPVRWWVPLLLLMALAVSFTFAYTQRVGWERFMREQIERSPRTQQLSPEQKDRIIEQQTRLAPIFGYVFGTLGWPFIVLVVSGVFLLVFNVILGSQLAFKTVFTGTAYGMLPNFIGGIVALVLMFLKAPADFDLEHPVASNLGVFLDPNTVPRWAITLAGSFDVFVLWTLVLLATAYSAAARRLSWSKAFTWVVATWLLWVVVKTGWIWIWS